MKSFLKKSNRLLILLVTVAAYSSAMWADSIPSGFGMSPEYRIGIEAVPSFVLATNPFFKGENKRSQKIDNSLAGSLRAEFSFHKDTREGILYPGLYQGIGIGAQSFFANDLLGTPLSAYVYQGAPIVSFNRKMTLEYEWKFGAAFGWEHHVSESGDHNAVVSTSTTAHMGLGLKLRYQLTDYWRIRLGIEATHFSNGNTTLPNSGVNTIGAAIGIAYTLHPQRGERIRSKALEEEADRKEWFYDVMAFGAWRRRILMIDDTPQLCPGRFGVLGLQFSPMRKLNRWVAVGGALDMQWDESGGLAPYHVEGSSDEHIKFYRPPFGKQLGIGLSAHAELTMPIFAVNIGIGYNLLNPEGDKRFYQSLTLKTFLTHALYLNTGYRLGNFKDPQNLMLGIGVRL